VDDGDAAPLRRFFVMVSEPADGDPAFRVEEPAHPLRLWSMLRATSEQVDRANLPPEGIPALQRQLQAIRGELERAVSPPLAAELRRILPLPDAVPNAGALRIECAILFGWAENLVVQTPRVSEIRGWRRGCRVDAEAGGCMRWLACA
jgi:hypothetical protein